MKHELPILAALHQDQEIPIESGEGLSRAAAPPPPPAGKLEPGELPVRKEDLAETAWTAGSPQKMVSLVVVHSKRACVPYCVPAPPGCWRKAVTSAKVQGE